MGCDHHVGDGLLVGVISIHAPQWGATHTAAQPFALRHISIHAPQWGATILGGLLPQSGINFNPRTPVGCDRVSRAWTCVGWRFQSTHPSGVRRQVNNNCLVSGVFQSTHPSGVRLYHDAATAYCRLISIHAPQWGATLRWSKRFTSSTRFQSTHPSGVRPSFWFPVGLADDFNPRTPVGCDIASLKEAQSIWISIHAPQWGATSGAPASARCVEFQSTHPSGVRQLT